MYTIIYFSPTGNSKHLTKILARELGLNESEEKYNKLKLTFESLLDYWGDYGKYNSGRTQMEESWREEAGI